MDQPGMKAKDMGAMRCTQHPGYSTVCEFFWGTSPRSQNLEGFHKAMD